MPKRAMETLTESMFYVLMALRTEPMCGIELAAAIEHHTERRVCLGPATLYTILNKFESDHYIKEVAVEGRKRTYAITEKGEEAYRTELRRLHRCITDAAAAEKGMRLHERIENPPPLSPLPVI